jgi:hypothetical protein
MKIDTVMPRFVTEDQLCELFNLFHLSRVPFTGIVHSEYERMQWAVAQFCKAYPEVSSTEAYKDLSDARDRWKKMS